MAIKKPTENTEAEDNSVILDGDSIFDNQEEPSRPATAVAANTGPGNELSAPAPTAVATKSNVVTSSVLSADEMEDLDFGFGAFPTVVLDKGEFECSGDIEFENNQFQCRIMSYRAKYFYRSVISEKDTEFFYSFDKPDTANARTTNEELVSDTIAKWTEANRPPHTIKKYLECTAQLLDGRSANSLCLLSVAPKSVPVLSGYIAGELGAVRGVHYSKVVTQVSAGPKNSKGDFPYRPWNFAYVSTID